MEITLIESLKNIDLIEKSWVKLLNVTNTKTVYLEPDFYRRLFTTRAGNAKPYIVFFEEDNKPVGIIIGWTLSDKLQSKIGYAKFKTLKLRILNIEIGGFVVLEHEKYQKYLIGYLEKLLSEKKFDLIRANHFSSQNYLYKHFLINSSSNSVLTTKSVEWFAEIRDKETGLAKDYNSSVTRQTFRRKDRKLVNSFDKVEIKEYKNKNEVNEFIEKAEEISKKNYHYLLGIGIINNEFWKNSLTAMAEGNYLRAYILFADNIPLAYYQGVVFKDIFYDFVTSYNSDYSKLSPGSYLLRRVKEICVENKINIFHFGYGDAEHKKVYGNNYFDEASLNIYGSTFKAKISKCITRSSIGINNFLIKLLKKTGYLKKIKNLWRFFFTKKAAKMD
ncbi:MAG: hypothetical protein CR986_02695 [Ignavibacteriae bacterium]|nr:MAG: hypothetical protein CR986_02695 [Ignavibacteriota bacterium]